MKRLLLVFVLCLLGGAWFYQWAQTRPSYLLIVVGNTSLEMSLWFALGVLLGLLLLLWLVHALLFGGVRRLGRQVSRLLVSGERRAERRTAAGLVSFIEGDWGPALRRLNGAAKRVSAPLVNYLAAARCAYELGDEQRANSLLAKAETCAPDAGLAVALSQARIQLLGKKYESCAATLERARKLSPRHPVVLDMLRQVYVQLQDWDALEKMLPALRRYTNLSEAELDQLCGLLYHKLLQRAAHSDFSLDAARTVWAKVPRHWQSDPNLLLEYVQVLESEGEAGNAELVLRKALQSHWDDRLILRYGTLRDTDAARQLLKAEHWLQERPGNSALLLTLGRLALRNQLWGKARDYFDHSLKLRETPEAFAELARLLAHLGEHELSTRYYQKGLLLMAGQLPELPLPAAGLESVRG